MALSPTWVICRLTALRRGHCREVHSSRPENTGASTWNSFDPNKARGVHTSREAHHPVARRRDFFFFFKKKKKKSSSVL